MSQCSAVQCRRKQSQFVLRTHGNTLNVDQAVIQYSQFGPAHDTQTPAAEDTYHNAVLCGLTYVTGDYVAIIDDDFQNPPKDVCKLVDEIINGNDTS